MVKGEKSERNIPKARREWLTTPHAVDSLGKISTGNSLQGVAG